MPRKPQASPGPKQELSNGFIESLVGNKQNHATKTEPHVVPDDRTALNVDTWRSARYSLDDGRTPHEATCSRCIVVSVSLLLALCGLLALVVALIERSHKILPLCPHCNTVVLGLYICGGGLLLVALLGVLGGKTQKKCCAFPFAAVAVAVAVVFLALAAAASVYYLELKTMDLYPLWHDAVLNDKEFICDVQESLHCSGIRDGCCNTNSTPVIINVSAFCYINTTLKPNWVNDVCVPSCASNKYMTRCDPPLQQKIKDHMLVALCAGGVLGLLLIAAAVASTKMIPRRRSYSDYF